MSNLAAEKILRVNCPGWGVSSTLPLGEAKPLAMYDVIVVNPISIVHLFEPKSDTAKQIEKAIAEGQQSLKLDNDSQLESISAELELREHELRQFLSKGGLLIYFLSPQFTVSGPSMSMDNYLWLYEWTPIKQAGTNHKVEKATNSKNISLFPRGKAHSCANYLQQSNLEWTSFVNDSKMTDGYKMLAVGGLGKVISASKSSGPKRGQVVFLPAPFDGKYDDILRDCLNQWHKLHTGPDADSPEPDYPESIGDKNPEQEAKALLDDLFAAEEAKKQASSAKSSSSTADELDSLFSTPSPAPRAETSDSLDDLFGDKPSRSTKAESTTRTESKANKDLDNLDDLFNDKPSSKTEQKANTDSDLDKAFERVIAGNETKADTISSPSNKIDDLFETPTVGNSKKNNLDWPELDNDIPPFAKEREREKELRERELALEKEREREREREKELRERELALEKEREREREKELRERELALEKEREHEREKELREHELALEKEREREREKELRERELALEKEREREREKELRERELARDDSQVLSNTFPEAKDLMTRMEQEVASPGIPDWCHKISFTELKQIHQDLSDLNEQVKRAKSKIADLEDRVKSISELKDSLLSLSGNKLSNAVSKVLESLGWSVKISEDISGELWLNDGDKTHAIVKIVYSPSQPNRSALAELAESVINHWGKYDIEPKGILIASTYAELPPKERKEEDFSASMSEFAKRKNLCLFTTTQLLSIYRDVAIRENDARKIRDTILSTNGILNGFELELTESFTEVETVAK